MAETNFKKFLLAFFTKLAPWHTFVSERENKFRKKKMNATASKLEFWEIAMEVSNAQLEFNSESGYQFISLIS